MARKKDTPDDDSQHSRRVKADVGLASALQSLARDPNLMADYRARGFSADLAAPTARKGRSAGDPLAVMCVQDGNERSFKLAIEDFDPSETPVERGSDQDLDQFFVTLLYCAKLNDPRFFNPLAKMALDESHQPRELFVSLWQAARSGKNPAHPKELASLIDGAGCLDELARGSAIFLSQRPNNAGEASELLRDLEALMSFESTRESLVWTHRIAAKKAALGRVTKLSGDEAGMKPMGAFLWGCLSRLAGKNEPAVNPGYWNNGAAATAAAAQAASQKAASDLSMRAGDDFDLALSFISADLVAGEILDDADISAMGKLLIKIPEGRRLAFAAAFERHALDAEIEGSMAKRKPSLDEEDDAPARPSDDDDWANELGLAPPPKPTGPRRI